MRFIFYSEFHFEKWDYENPMNPGIGGSETAHIECALRLAKRGHEVISYSPIKDTTQKNYKGVTWLDSKDADFSLKGNWFISREPQVIDKFTKEHKGQKISLVMQDTFYHTLDKKRAEKFNYLLPLCFSHKNHTTKQLPDSKDKIVQSSNGIRTDIIKKIEKEGIKRDPHKLFFASSPDRGLVALLMIFKKAKELIPDLTLEIAYGFDNIEKFSGEELDIPLGDEKVTRRQIMKLADQEGVQMIGRIGQMELYRKWFETGVWLHPSAVFPETSCITSMDAQACGAIPITSPLWALADNVKYGYFIQGQPLTDPLIRLIYLEKLKDLLIKRDQKEVETMRVEMMEYARKRFDWNNIVDQYEALAKV